MDFDFDQVIDRRRPDAYKWNVAEGELPMWVADMDFATAQVVRDALQRRVAHPIFGYTDIPEAWADAYVGWWRNRHGFTIDPEWLIFSAGVVPTISTAVRRLTAPAENVVVMTPAYNIFFNSIVNNGRRVLESPLKYSGGAYSVDWENLEGALADPQSSMLILCNPHNPVGRAWDAATLERIGALVWEHGVVVLSDEIHGDITDPGVEYTPFASVSEKCRLNSVTAIAPTKAFNIAGIQTSAVVVPEPTLRHRIWRALNTDEVGEPNAFAIDAAIAAFTGGGQWLEAMCAYVFANKQRVASFLAEKLPKLHLVESEATYLLWIDCSAVSADSEELAARIRRETGLYLAAGAQYGGNGAGFLRMNVACPRSVLNDGLARLERALS